MSWFTELRTHSTFLHSTTNPTCPVLLQLFPHFVERERDADPHPCVHLSAHDINSYRVLSLTDLHSYSCATQNVLFNILNTALQFPAYQHVNGADVLVILSERMLTDNEQTFRPPLPSIGAQGACSVDSHCTIQQRWPVERAMHSQTTTVWPPMLHFLLRILDRLTFPNLLLVFLRTNRPPGASSILSLARCSCMTM